MLAQLVAQQTFNLLVMGSSPIHPTKFNNMKLSKFIKGLQKSLKEHGDLEVITSIDSEGNGYNEVYYEPSAGYFNADEGEWVSLDHIKDDPEYYEDYKDKKPNAICVN